MKNFRIGAVATLGLLLVVAGIVAAQQKGYFTKSKWKDVVIEYEWTRVSPSGVRVRKGYDIRYQKSDGSWKETQTTFDANGNPHSCKDVYSDQSGVFRVDHETKQQLFEGKAENKAFFFDETKIPAEYRKDGGEVLGYRTLVFTAEAGPGDSVELYKSPELNGMTLKEVTRYADGGYDERVAIRIHKGPVEFEKRPDYPVKDGK